MVAPLVLVLMGLTSPADAAPPSALETGQARLEELTALLSRPSASDDELVAAIDALGDCCVELLRPSPPAEEPGKEERRLVRSAASLLLRIVGAPPKDRKAARDDRNAPRTAAVVALRSAEPAVAAALRGVLEDRVYGGKDLRPLPSFHDEAFDTLLRLDAEGSWPWILEKAVNAESDPVSRSRNVAALDALRRYPEPTAAMRFAGVRRLVSIFQAPDAFWNSWYEEIAGLRHSESKKQNITKWWYGQFWLDIRDPVIEALRRFATDPVTGAPPVDVDDGSEMFLVRRYIVWQARHGFRNQSPWVDGRTAPQEPGEWPARPKLSPIERLHGISWERWWRENRRLARVEGYSVEDPFDRRAHRSGALPGILAPLLEDPEPVVRAAAAVQWGRTGVEKAAERLRALLRPDEPRVVREGAALGMLLLGDAGQRDFLRLLAGDGDEAPRVRAAAVLALGRIGDGLHVRETFLAKGSREPEELRACAVAALGLAGDAAEAPFLVSMLTDGNAGEPVRGQAGTALLRLRNPAVAETLRRILAEAGKDRTRHVTEVAAALAWAGVADPADRRGWETLARFCDTYEDRFGGSRNALIVGLGTVPGPLAHRFLSLQLEECSRDFRRPAEIGFHLLALGRQGTDEARALLRKALVDLKHERDLGACAIGLALAGDRVSAEAILALLERSERYAVPPSMLALGLLGHRPATETIRRIAAGSSDVEVLENAALALALLHGEGAFPDLVALWERCREPELRDGLAEAFRIAASERSVAWLRARAEDRTRPPLERAFALSALGRMAEDAEGSALDVLARDHNPYTGALVLDGFVRHRDMAPLRTGER